MVGLDTRLRSVVGDASAKKLAAAFSHETVEDLLLHFPRRYIALGELSDLSDLEVGQYATVMARVVDVKSRRAQNGKLLITEVIVTDGTARLSLTFFNQKWIEKILPPDTESLFSGVVGEFNRKLQLTHPFHQPVDEDGRLARGIIPVYPATEKVNSFQLEKAIGTVLDVVDVDADPVPSELLDERGLSPRGRAFEQIHRPRSARDWQKARDRFKFEEAFVVQSVFARRRLEIDGQTATARPLRDGGIREAFVERLPFELTSGQQNVVAEISDDLSLAHPMHRLLQGEVGSGKTIVALLAMLQVVDAGGQAALLAPTEVLAAQHHRGITQLLGDLAAEGMLVPQSLGFAESREVPPGAEHATRVRLLTGSLGAQARREALLDAASGQAGIVVGTHALIQEHVQFAELGLVVVDEQHRFGVEQRAALSDRAEVKPHVLVMTATPIPRTVAMTVFGDLETSTLTELPAGRSPIQTNVVPAGDKPGWLDRAWQRVREEVERGRQAYVVVSRIGTADERDVDAATRSLIDVASDLTSGALAGLRVGTLHGRMPADEKDAAMTAFASGETQVLIATTVVEVGVDVPNATVMVVLDAERFGISQLHQLRGRVGRGTEPGLCLLVTWSQAPPSLERLDAVASTMDGFRLSQLDVELRREGDVLGTRQSGIRSSLRLLSVVRDGDVIVDARASAEQVVRADPEFTLHPALGAAVAALEATEQADYLEKA